MAYRRQGDLQAGDVLTAEYLNQVNENTNQNHDDLEQYKLRANDKFDDIHDRQVEQSRDISAALFGLTDLDQKSSYHLGTYDNVVENADGTVTITRQTGYVDLSKLAWSVYPEDNATRIANINLDIYSPFTYVTSNNYQCGYSNGILYVNVGTSDVSVKPSGLLQYKLATSYQEKVIPNRPLNTLDQNGSQWVRDEWEKGLNLWNFVGSETKTQYGNTVTLNGSILTISGTNTGEGIYFGSFDFSEPIKANKTYTISIPNQHGISIAFYDVNGNEITHTDYVSSFTFTPNADIAQFTIWITGNGYAWGTTTIKLMLNEGDHAYPYVPYNANKHITNDEATLLKDEWEKSANLANVQETNETIAGVNNTTTSQHIIINGTATSDNAVFARCNLTSLPRGTYTIKFFGQKLPSGCYVFDGTSPKFVNNGSSITIETGFGQNYFQFNTTINSYYDLDFYIMLVKGSTAPTIYQPYNGEIVHKKELDDVQNNLNAFKQGMIIKESENYKVVFNENYGFYITDKNDENDPRFFVGLNNYAMYMIVGNTEYNLMPKKTWSIKGYGTYGTEGSYPLELSQFFFTITVDANIRFSQDEVINRLKGTEIPVSGTRITYTSAQSTAEHAPALTFKVESDGTMYVSHERTSGYHELGQLWGRALTSITFTLLGEYK